MQSFSEKQFPNPELNGKAIIFSAPSGAGKTTIVNHLLSSTDLFGFSISACTRKKRPHEVDGKDYHFITVEEFHQKKEEEAFIEWEEVYAGAYYGTLKSEIEGLWKAGKHVLFDVDVKGGLKLKEYFQERALAIFISTPSIAVLEERLRKRGTEGEEKIRERIAKYSQELAYKSKFDRVICNEELDSTLNEAERIILDFIKND